MTLVFIDTNIPMYAAGTPHTLQEPSQRVVRARDLAARYPGLSPGNLIHAAVALRHQASDIMTADRGFDTVEGLRRLDPSRFASRG